LIKSQYLSGDDDPDAALSVQNSDREDLEFLLIIIGEMRRTFDKFPEVLMIDGTYRVNKLRMPLCFYCGGWKWPGTNQRF